MREREKFLKDKPPPIVKFKEEAARFFTDETFSALRSEEEVWQQTEELFNEFIGEGRYISFIRIALSKTAARGSLWWEIRKNETLCDWIKRGTVKTIREVYAAWRPEFTKSPIGN